MPWIKLCALVVVLDQISKQYAENSLVLHKAQAMFTGFNLTLMYNEGAAFSFLSDAGGWQRWFLVALSSAISIALVVWLRQLDNSKRVLSLGLALILAGAMGNLLDRILFGHVIDFIQVYYFADSCLPGFTLYKYISGGQCIWPAFNIADSAIFLGACLLIADMLLEHRQAKTNV